MSDERTEAEIEELARRFGPWMLVAVLLLGAGAFALTYAITPPDSALVPFHRVAHP